MNTAIGSSMTPKSGSSHKSVFSWVRICVCMRVCMSMCVYSIREMRSILIYIFSFNRKATGTRGIWQSDAGICLWYQQLNLLHHSGCQNAQRYSQRNCNTPVSYTDILKNGSQESWDSHESHCSNRGSHAKRAQGTNDRAEDPQPYRTSPQRS